MTDSYLAPADLAAARARAHLAAAARCGAAGADPAEPGVVVELSAAPFDRQRERVTERTVVLMADAVLWRWTADDRAQLAAVLAEPVVGEVPVRSLVFVEPTAGLGWRRLAQRLGRPLWRRRLGHDFECDVPAALRAAGLVVTTQDRFDLGPTGIRSHVWGEARRYRHHP
ncbi:MAG: hypothetical protein AAF547_24280 [Actinomycetota bacterium]